MSARPHATRHERLYRMMVLGAVEVNNHCVTSLGPGQLTRDGCAVEVYLRLPAAGEPQMVHAIAGDVGSVLDLGAGVGRIADPLVELGHRVVAVDESAGMLSHVRFAETVRSDIEALRLQGRFDVVLLASHLVNTPDVLARGRLLASVAHHLAPPGRALIQWHRPEWFDVLQVGRVYSREVGDLHSELQVHTRDGDELSATVRYLADQNVWAQSFRACRLTTADMADLLGAAGLELINNQTVAPGRLLARRTVTSS